MSERDDERISEGRLDELMGYNDAFGPHNFPDGIKPITRTELTRLLAACRAHRDEGADEAWRLLGEALDEMCPVVDDPTSNYAYCPICPGAQRRHPVTREPLSEMKHGTMSNGKTCVVPRIADLLARRATATIAAPAGVGKETR